MSVVWEDPLPPVREGTLICWGDENKPLEITLLTMAIPCNGEVEAKAHNLNQGSRISSPLLDWVLETMSEFGSVLGASFEGYKEQLLSMLQDIEKRRNQQGVEKNLGVKSKGSVVRSCKI